MTAYNVIRFRAKPGREKQFVDYQRRTVRGFAGFQGGSLIQTGDRTFCLVGRWKSQQSIISARPQMIAVLDGMRDLLEDLGGGLGVTDPVSGEVVVEIPAAGPAKKAAKKKAAPLKAKKKAAKKTRR
jgi:hypothetical protein